MTTLLPAPATTAALRGWQGKERMRMDQKRCGTYETVKAEGAEPFRCTLPDGHWDREHPLVQASTGKKRAVYDPAYCSGGRIALIYMMRA